MRGTFDLVESFHPADRALRLAPASAVVVTLGVVGAAEGASLALNARCEPGGALVFVDDGTHYAAIDEIRVPPSEAWTRHEWSLRFPKHVHDTSEAAKRDRMEPKLLFENRGTGACSIDRVVYRTTARVCSSWDTKRVCSRYTEPDAGGWYTPVDANKPDTGRRDTYVPDPEEPDAADELDADEVDGAHDVSVTDSVLEVGDGSSVADAVGD